MSPKETYLIDKLMYTFVELGYIPLFVYTEEHKNRHSQKCRTENRHSLYWLRIQPRTSEMEIGD